MSSERIIRKCHRIHSYKQGENHEPYVTIAGKPRIIRGKWNTRAPRASVYGDYYSEIYMLAYIDQVGKKEAAHEPKTNNNNKNALYKSAFRT